MNSLKNKPVPINKRIEISETLNNGKYITTQYGKLIIYNSTENINPKYALLIKKYCGKAVYRNYLKRILRSYFRNKITLFQKYNRVIFLFNYKKSEINFKQLKKELDRILISILVRS